jgi:hypothetical protein
MTEDILVELARLQAENARLKAILQQHGITWDAPLPPAPPVVKDEPVGVPAMPPPTSLSSADKIVLFQSLFRGRMDISGLRMCRRLSFQPVSDQERKTSVALSAACAAHYPGLTLACHEDVFCCFAGNRYTNQ